MDKQYLVKWEIDLSSDSPINAAKLALEVQRDKTNEALAFTVMEQATGEETDVDLLSDETTGVDVCYRCGCVQEYGTMKDVNETEFAIYCKSCHPIETAIKELGIIEEKLDANSVKSDWTDDEISMEINYLYGKIYNLIKILKGTK